MYCKRLLAQGSSNNSFILVNQDVDATRNKSLEEWIPSFFSDRNHGLHVAIVCGTCEPWDEDALSEALQKAQDGKIVIGFRADAPPAKVTGQNGYCTVINETNGETTSLIGNAIKQIGLILENVWDKLVFDNSSITEISKKETKSGIEASKTIFDLICDFLNEKKFDGAFTKIFAERLDSNLKKLPMNNLFPDIYLLIFFPKSAFEVFDDCTHYFPKQFRFVIEALDPYGMIQELLELKRQSNETIRLLQEKLDKSEGESIWLRGRLDEATKKLKSIELLCRKMFNNIRSILGEEFAFEDMSSIPEPTTQIYLHPQVRNDVLRNSDLSAASINEYVDEHAKGDPHYAQFISRQYNVETDNKSKNYDTDELKSPAEAKKQNESEGRNVQKRGEYTKNLEFDDEPRTRR